MKILPTNNFEKNHTYWDSKNSNEFKDAVQENQFGLMLMFLYLTILSVAITGLGWLTGTLFLFTLGLHAIFTNFIEWWLKKFDPRFSK